VSGVRVFFAATVAVAREIDVLLERDIPRRRRASLTLELLRLALPLIAVTTSRMLMGFIDVTMVSRLGTEALAAILPAALMMWAFICLGAGTGTSVQTFASQADGRGEPQRGAAYAWQTVYLGIAFMPLAYAGSKLAPALYDWLGFIAHSPAPVRALEIAYTQIAVWSMVPATIAAGFEGFFNGVQRPRVTLAAVLASLAANAIGNYVLIFGPELTVPYVGWHIHFPALGIAGAALATVIAWSVRVVVLLAVFCSAPYDRRYSTRRAFAPSWHKWLDILHVGGPTAVAWEIDISSWVVFLNVIVPSFGTKSLAATNIALQYTHLAFMPAIGVGMALCSQVGFAIGAGRPDEAVRRTHVALGLTMAYMGSIGLLLFGLRAPLMWWFTSDTGVAAIGVSIMGWVAAYQVFDAMSITFISSLRGAGDTRTPAVLSGLCCWGIFIGGGYLVAHARPHWGVHGPWLMAVVYLTVLGLALLWRYRSGGWRKIRLLEEPGVAGPAVAAVPLGTGGGET
jgi:MATE family multidrug resistance protein